MASYAEELESRDIGVLVIGFDELQTLDDMKRRLSSPFIFMRDASRAGYRTLGLGRAPGSSEPTCTPMCCDHTPRFALQGEFPKLRRRQDRRQLGGDFVVRRNGQVILSHREQGPEDRAPVGAIIAAARSAAEA